MAEQQRRLKIADVRPGGREVFPVTWPGGREVNLLLLRCSDLQAAHFAAVERFKKQDQPMDTITALEEFGREKNLQEVFRMVLRPDSKLPNDRLFKDADEARAELGIDEVQFFEEKHAELTRETLKKRGFQVQVKDGAGSTDPSD
jgi:hypothetical protein